MAKSKHRKKHAEKKKAKNREVLVQKKRLKRYMSEFAKHSAMAESEKNERRSKEMQIIREWGEGENATPTQQMLFG